jgi:hypothetical protein
VRAFDLTCIALWRDVTAALGVCRNPSGCPAKAAGKVVRAANANGKDVIAAAAARGSSSFGTRIHPDAMSEPHIARRLPSREFGGPPTEGIVARGRSVDLVLHDAEPEIAG